MSEICELTCPGKDKYAPSDRKILYVSIINRNQIFERLKIARSILL